MRTMRARPKSLWLALAAPAGLAACQLALDFDRGPLQPGVDAGVVADAAGDTAVDGRGGPSADAAANDAPAETTVDAAPTQDAAADTTTDGASTEDAPLEGATDASPDADATPSPDGDADGADAAG